MLRYYASCFVLFEVIIYQVSILSLAFTSYLGLRPIAMPSPWLLIFTFSFKAQVHVSGLNNSQHCWGLLANNVVSVCMDRRVFFDRFPTVRNKCQQVPTLLWFHANGCNKSQHCWAQQCCVLLANNVGSVCMGL